MLDWLFGKKEEKEKKEEKKEQVLDKDDQWIYDYVRQYLSSPLWRNPLLDFIEENCLVFEDTEENKFEYTKIYQEFTGLTALLLETMIEEVGITETILEKCIIKGMKSQRDAKIFQQILLCDNFLSFKKIMVAKNKELQVEAMRKFQSQAKGQSKAEEKQIQIDAKELERMELEKAIAMSKAIEQKTQDKELEQAIRMSQMEYEKEEVKRTEEMKKIEKKEQIKKTLLGPLPPISTAKPLRPIQEYKEEESKLKVQIQQMKKVEEVRREKQKEEKEDQEERKKRLLEQREMIRKKKQDERKEELTNFVQSKQTENKLSEEELDRRRNLMKRLKEQLKD